MIGTEVDTVLGCAFSCRPPQRLSHGQGRHGTVAGAGCACLKRILALGHDLVDLFSGDRVVEQPDIIQEAFEKSKVSVRSSQPNHSQIRFFAVVCLEVNL